MRTPETKHLPRLRHWTCIASHLKMAPVGSRTENNSRQNISDIQSILI